MLMACNSYVAADYERSQFSISPATWPSPLSSTDIRPVHPPGRTGLGPGQIAGIVIGSIVGLNLVIALTLFAWRSCNRKTRTETLEGTMNAASDEVPKSYGEGQEPRKPELDANETAIKSDWNGHELEGDTEGIKNFHIEEVPNNEIIEAAERGDPAELSASNPVELPITRD